MVYAYHVNHMITEFLRIYLFLNIVITEYRSTVKPVLSRWDLTLPEFSTWPTSCVCSVDISVPSNSREILSRLLTCTASDDMTSSKLTLFHLAALRSICSAFFVLPFISNHLTDSSWILTVGHKINLLLKCYRPFSTEKNLRNLRTKYNPFSKQTKYDCVC